jgi:hypothetical protein
MAKINKLGNIIASCPGCDGSISTFEYMHQGRELGFTTVQTADPHPHIRFSGDVDAQFRLYRCAGCGMGGLGLVIMRTQRATYPGDIFDLEWFMPESRERLALPEGVLKGIMNEFREGEKCMENDTLRAAAGMFRSVLDKTLRANGYKTKKSESLAVQIDEAAKDGVITAARQRRAHEEIRVLGNDVLHDEWHEIGLEDVEAAHHYCQRILEDFYDDRDSTLRILRGAGRIPDEDREKGDAGTES